MTSNQKNNIDELIVAFLSGEATGEAQEQLLQWIKSGDECKEYYERMRDAWLASAQAGVLPAERVEQALQQIDMMVVEKRLFLTP